MVMGLADWETLPYDSFSPHQDIISSRLATLYQLPTMQRGVLIVPVSTLMQRVCPHSFLHGHALVMKKGQRLSRDALRDQLEGRLPPCRSGDGARRIYYPRRVARPVPDG